MTYEEEIEELRLRINRLNREIVDKLGQRVRVAREIGEIKKSHGKPIVDRVREERVIDQVRELAEESGIDPEGIERVFREIIDLCTRAEA